MTASTIWLVVLAALQVLTLIRVILRPHREPTSRIAWVAIVMAVPVVGVIAYLLMGEVNIGRRRVRRKTELRAELQKADVAFPGEEANLKADVPDRYAHLFRVGQSISGLQPVGGNSAKLMADSNAAIDSLTLDIDAAKDHVHVLFYIWLTDNNGCKVVDALNRAARRGVKCRAMVDSLGSRGLVKSKQWRSMRDAGVQVAVALRIGNPLLRPLIGRIDLRNHRKIVVIDGTVTYCGSQNCADPEFRVKARFAPWVDAVVRFEGPIARQNQRLFAADWMTYTNENIDNLLASPVSAPRPGFAAQVIGTGPTVRNSAMPELFESLIYTARRELVITTPYYVPDEAMQSALCASAYRGVKTTIIFPARNDSWIVAGASRSYYADLLEAGVQIYEYVGGLLHTKSLALDGEITLIGSANMDRRSFDLNFENNILVYDSDLTAEVRRRQNEYIARSRQITRQYVESWTMARRIWNNTMAMMGPIL